MAVAQRWDMTGQRFGSLSVMWPVGRKINRSSVRAVWALCCDCGTTVYSRRDALIEGRTKSCGCQRRARALAGLPALKHGFSRKSHRRVEATIYHNARQRARRLGLEFSITVYDIKIPEFCPVLGIPLVSRSKLHDGSPTLDRRDTSRGYSPDNVRVISWRANRIKSDSTAEELEKILCYMSD